MKKVTLLLGILSSTSFCAANQVSEAQQPFIKRYENQKRIIAPEEARLNSEPEPDLSEGFVSLYNGKDLSNWTARGGYSTFEARADRIVGTCVKGSPSTYLSTLRNDYSNFIFTAELKWVIDGNSGIMFRAQYEPTQPYDRVFGPQCEMEGFAPILKRQRGWSGGIYGQGYAAWIYPLWLEAHSAVRQALKKDDWNRITIKANNETVKTWVNGLPAAHWVNDQFLKGFFGLQVHSGKQGEIHFRNIKVKELNNLPEVHMANGIKIGEVDSDSAIIWTRLTVSPERNTDGVPFPKSVPGDPNSVWPDTQPTFPDLSIMQGSVCGAAGKVRLSYWCKGAESAAHTTQWERVYPQNDYTHQFILTSLDSAAQYEIRVEGKNEDGNTCQSNGSFITAPATDASSDIRFVVTTCGDYPRRDDPLNGHKIYPKMQALQPNFFVHAGDIEYYDRPAPYAKNLKLARFKWNRLYAMPYLRDFHSHTASYFMKDDHDTIRDDAWPGTDYFDLTWEQGLATFREQVPMGDKTYRTVRWGKDLQIWLVEGRDFRSANTTPDGPQKTIWGSEQKQWFFDTVRASNASFKILISPTPIVGPDRWNKNDNHANPGFSCEGNELRAFMAEQNNMFVICGDRHWQYASVDPITGLREFSCGPASDKHAAGYSEELRKDMHSFLRVKGGFLRVELDSTNKILQFYHHAVDGSVVYEESFSCL